MGLPMHHLNSPLASLKEDSHRNRLFIARGCSGNSNKFRGNCPCSPVKKKSGGHDREGECILLFVFKLKLRI